MTLFGKRANMPVVIAPTGFNGLLWPQGDVALARAAATAGIPFTLSTVANCSIEHWRATRPATTGSSSTPSRIRARWSGWSTARATPVSARWW